MHIARNETPAGAIDAQEWPIRDGRPAPLRDKAGVAVALRTKNAGGKTPALGGPSFWRVPISL